MTPHDRPIRCPWCHQLDVTDYIHNDYMDAECKSCHRLFERRDEARDLFHLLWGRSIDTHQGSARYYKDIWNRLSLLLRF